MPLGKAQEAICESCGLSRNNVVTLTPDPAPRFVPDTPDQIFVPAGDVVDEDSPDRVLALLPWGWRRVPREDTTVLSQLSGSLRDAATALYRDVESLFTEYLDSVTQLEKNHHEH